MDHQIVKETENDLIIPMVADVVAAYVANNSIRPSELAGLVLEVHAAFAKASAQPVEEPEVEKQKPAVNPKRSVFADYIICLEDGQKFKSLKRHIKTHYDLTPEQYREKWNLDSNYPMVAPNYAEARSALAKQMGLGRKSEKKKGK
ncbi:MucR family transcriptional regulator [Bartonella tamiae]|uniref:Transcriptional regulator n=1 Tax=Bartonella tamiae Th239 TaxID=1094558 RepID=J0R4I3_9HYPH|nr:MucR family transcriptional regulator [Bartonella tamiae]EJF90569.1 hypothetical protein ME5_00970 [Bartonella tamiae Th239]EJF94053.1 hypothetical protein MEG_00911 [Bartonella tamiae Th307]